MSRINARFYTKSGVYAYNGVMPKPIRLDLPYPTADEVCPDALSLKIISPAYASATGELGAILQYVYHSFFFGRDGYKESSDTLMGIAIAEMTHLQILGKTILALGAAPVYTQYPPNAFNFYSTKYIAYSRTLRHMLEDDIRGERQAICGYEKMLKYLKSEPVIKIVSRILEDERLHLSVLEKMLSEFKG